MVTVKFFAMLRNLAGSEGAEYEVSAPMTLEELKALITADFPSLRPVLEGRSVLISINQEFATGRSVVNDGDEVALLPPFSGG